MPVIREPLAMKDAPSEASDPGALAARYGTLVFRAAYRVLGDATQAEDVQQDVFLRLLRSRPRGVASWPAWLTTSATRLAIDALRRRQRRWAFATQWRAQAESTSASAEEAGLDAERAARLRAALGRLSRREAQCFALRYLEGMALTEVAAALSLTENNVGVALHRARRRLETLLRDSHEEVRA